jgi:hypothetical protein
MAHMFVPSQDSSCGFPVVVTLDTVSVVSSIFFTAPLCETQIYPPPRAVQVGVEKFEEAMVLARVRFMAAWAGAAKPTTVDKTTAIVRAAEKSLDFLVLTNWGLFFT